MRPLLERLPALERIAPCVPLGDFPTPVTEAPAIAEQLGLTSFHVKRDDQSARPYGGNKVRKLEFLLGRARQQGRRALITFGTAGSNHALATAVYGRREGFEVTSILLPQPVTRATGRNLRFAVASGARVVPVGGELGAARAVGLRIARDLVGTGRPPGIIPPGGSTPRGTLGFVNAALELATQIEAGVLPRPDVIVCPSGTMGTSIGLAVGLQLAALPIEVRAFDVAGAPYTSARKATRLFDQVARLLVRADASVGRLRLDPRYYTLRHDQLGRRYAEWTSAGVAAMKLARARGDLELEGTYTGKAMAGLMSDAGNGDLTGKRVLFWHTYNAHDFDDAIEKTGPEQVPAGFRRYFEEPPQVLDRDE